MMRNLNPLREYEGTIIVEITRNFKIINLCNAINLINTVMCQRIIGKIKKNELLKTMMIMMKQILHKRILMIMMKQILQVRGESEAIASDCGALRYGG